jgi:hypothetical protein
MVDASGERCACCNAPSTHECDYCYRETCDSCDVQCFECATLIGCVSCAARQGGEQRQGRWYCENCPLPENVLTEEDVIL